MWSSLITEVHLSDHSIFVPHSRFIRGSKSVYKYAHNLQPSFETSLLLQVGIILILRYTARQSRISHQPCPPITPQRQLLCVGLTGHECGVPHRELDIITQ